MRAAGSQRRGGDRTFVDYAGSTVPIVHPATGEEREAQLFVVTLGVKTPDPHGSHMGPHPDGWTGAHVHMLESRGSCSGVQARTNELLAWRGNGRATGGWIAGPEDD